MNSNDNVSVKDDSLIKGFASDDKLQQVANSLGKILVYACTETIAYTFDGFNDWRDYILKQGPIQNGGIFDRIFHAKAGNGFQKGEIMTLDKLKKIVYHAWKSFNDKIKGGDACEFNINSEKTSRLFLKELFAVDWKPNVNIGLNSEGLFPSVFDDDYNFDADFDVIHESNCSASPKLESKKI
jgi:hypothetical protein